jgi:hypothetical protein
MNQLPSWGGEIWKDHYRVSEPLDLEVSAIPLLASGGFWATIFLQNRCEIWKVHKANYAVLIALEIISGELR